MSETPSNFKELFEFYYDIVKPLYSSVQASNCLPTEVLFEINAAFDHISRHWQYEEDEKKSIRQAYAHLKRSCLDIYKLKLKETIDLYEELCAIDTSVIDNGAYDLSLKKLYNEIRQQATEARRSEGQANSDINRVFGRWQEVYELCVELEQKYYFHPSIDWAKKKSLKKFAVTVFLGIIIGVIANALSAPIFGWIKSLF